jgi:hypothetical protein
MVWTCENGMKPHRTFGYLRRPWQVREPFCHPSLDTPKLLSIRSGIMASCLGSSNWNDGFLKAVIFSASHLILRIGIRGEGIHCLRHDIKRTWAILGSLVVIEMYVSVLYMCIYRQVCDSPPTCPTMGFKSRSTRALSFCHDLWRHFV